MSAEIDNIILGQGIAGITMAIQLAKRAETVLLISSPKIPSATSISSGIANPIIGKGLNVSHEATKAFEYALSFYRGLESDWDEKFYHQQSLLKIIANQKQAEKFTVNKSMPEFTSFLKQENYVPPKNIKNDFGCFLINSFWLDTKNFISAFEDALPKNISILKTKFNYQDLFFENDMPYWQSYRAKRIIFAEGYMAERNPYASFLNFRSASGEILDLKIPALSEDFTYNFGNFLQPIGNQIFRLGATYAWDNFDSPPSETAKSELLENFDQFFDYDYSVVNHVKGVRPVVHGRQPVICAHPEHKNIFFFNGLGSKGCLLYTSPSPRDKRQSRMPSSA